MSYCNWDKTSKINQVYHDTEWGIPLHDDRGQFEYLMLEVMQCGLNWDLVINKREIFKKCFDNFDFEKVSKYSDADVERIMNTDGMIKSRRKIEAVINNAKCFLEVRKIFGSFSEYLWAFSENKTILYDKHELGYIPVSNGLSDKISRDLKKRGFKFVGTVTMYSHLQACGIINDHDINCPRRAFINSNYPAIKKRRYLEKSISFFGGK